MRFDRTFGVIEPKREPGPGAELAGIAKSPASAFYEDTDDDQGQKIIKGRVGLLELAKQLGNVSQACKILGLLAGRRQRRRAGRPQEAHSREPGRAVANEMRKLGFSISPAGVRGIWLRHDL